MAAIGDHQILNELMRAVDGGEPVVLATIVTTEGSVPRHAGTKMLVRPDGSMLGTVGGGKVEIAVQADALEALGGRRASTHRYVLQDPDSGDPGVCGGIMTVYLEPYMTPHTVYVIGAGHVGRAVVDLAHWLGYRTVVVDDRSELVSEEAMPNADVRFAGTVELALAAHPVTERSSIVVVTRSHEVDTIIMPMLAATPAAYVGVMGSKRRWEVTTEALRTQGMPDEALGRIHNPIGIDIGAESVEEIAVSILSEVIAVNAQDE